MHPKRVTLSTVGLVPMMDKLAQEELMPNLAVSLHAATEETRRSIVPPTKKYSLQDILDACKRFPLSKRRRIMFEYVMLAGVNDGYAQAVQLAQLLDPKIFKVNLIPFNPTDATYEGSSREAIAAFKAALEEHGVNATVRLTRGRDIDAACGQLAAKA